MSARLVFDLVQLGLHGVRTLIGGGQFVTQRTIFSFGFVDLLLHVSQRRLQAGILILSRCGYTWRFRFYRSAYLSGLLNNTSRPSSVTDPRAHARPQHKRGCDSRSDEMLATLGEGNGNYSRETSRNVCTEPLVAFGSDAFFIGRRASQERHARDGTGCRNNLAALGTALLMMLELFEFSRRQLSNRRQRREFLESIVVKHLTPPEQHPWRPDFLAAR